MWKLIKKKKPWNKQAETLKSMENVILGLTLRKTDQHGSENRLW